MPSMLELAKQKALHEKTFACECCGKCFGMKQDLNKHKVIHKEKMMSKFMLALYVVASSTLWII